MSSAKELRDQLRELRKEAVKPVSKMRKSDISAEIQRLKGTREETPISAATVSPASKKMAPSVETIKEAKAKEFPVAPVSASKSAKESGAKGGKKVDDLSEKIEKAEKKKSKLEKLIALIESDSD